MLIGKGMVLLDPYIMSTTLTIASGSRSVDVAFLVEANGFAGLASSLDSFLGGKVSSPSLSSSLKDRGVLLAWVNSPNPKEVDRGVSWRN